MPEPSASGLDQATLDALFESVGHDAEFMAELIDTYLDDAPAQVESLRSALGAGDVEGLVRPAHSLKSASASIGALGLAEQCRQLEQSARGGAFEGADDAVRAIAAELELVVGALEQAKQSFAV